MALTPVVVLVVSMAGDSPVTSIVSTTAATSRLTGSVTVRSRPTTTPVWLTVLKPESSTLTV